jgi:hypothetical protein
MFSDRQAIAGFRKQFQASIFKLLRSYPHLFKSARIVWNRLELQQLLLSVDSLAAGSHMAVVDWSSNQGTISDNLHFFPSVHDRLGFNRSSHFA